MRRSFRILTALTSVALWGAVASLSLAQTAKKQGAPASPPARTIAGVNAKDPYPAGCVDCHIVNKEKNQDLRLSVLMAKWMDKVEPELVETTKAVSADASKVKGKHPKAPAALKSIPGSCMPCHKKDSKMGPPFSRLMHVVHLGRGDQSAFLTPMQGECSSCHKVDTKTGLVTIPSGPEK